MFNCHREDFNLVNVNHVIKVVVDLLVQGKAFAWLGEKRETKNSDLFSNGSTKTASGIPLKNYKSRARGN